MHLSSTTSSFSAGWLNSVRDSAFTTRREREWEMRNSYSAYPIGRVMFLSVLATWPYCAKLINFTTNTYSQKNSAISVSICISLTDVRYLLALIMLEKSYFWKTARKYHWRRVKNYTIKELKSKAYILYWKGQSWSRSSIQEEKLGTWCHMNWWGRRISIGTLNHTMPRGTMSKSKYRQKCFIRRWMWSDCWRYLKTEAPGSIRQYAHTMRK